MSKRKTEPDAFKRTVLFVATLSVFLTPFMSSSINIALPTIGREFAMDAVLLSWVSTSYLLTAAIFLIPFGRISDIYGRKKIFTYGIIFFTSAAIISALSPSGYILIALRILQGIGAAMIFSTSTAILASVFPPGERGRAFGINIASVYLGLSLGPFIGGFITQHFGWRTIFWLNVPLGITIITLILWKLKGEWIGAKGEKFDWIGSIIYSLSLTAIMYGFSQLPRLFATLLVAGGIAGIILFILYEKRLIHPLFDIIHLRKNRVFAFSNLAALINYSATYAVAFLLSLYLQYTKGLSPQKAGLVLVAQPFMQAIFSPIAGRLSDKFQPQKVAAVGMGITVIGLVPFAFLSSHTSLALIIGDLMLLGFGFALFSSPNINAVMGSVDRKFFGVATGTLGTMRLMGMTFSMGIVMLLFALYLGRQEIIPEYYPLFLKSVKTAFSIFIFLCAGGIVSSLVRNK